jgi:hypothetical protein
MSTRVLASFNNDIEANIIKCKLEDAGIMCFLANENFSNIMPHYSYMMGGGINLVVNKHDYDRAYKILHECEPRSDDNKVICPGCKSTNIKFSFGNGFWATILFVVLSLFAAIPMGNLIRKYNCQDCGLRF